MKTKVILISHALTQWNIDNRVQGHVDTPLAEIGHEMALVLARTLNRKSIDTIYTSDLRRSYETALPLSDMKKIRIIKDERLREVRRVNQESGKEFPTLQFHIVNEDETMALIRFRAALTEIAELNLNQTLLVVSHSAIIRLFIHAMIPCKSDYLNLRMALNYIIYNGTDWKITKLNDIHYMNHINFNQTVDK